MTVDTNWFGTPQQIKIDQTKPEYPWSTEADKVAIRSVLTYGSAPLEREILYPKTDTTDQEKAIQYYRLKRYILLAKWLASGRTMVHLSSRSIAALVHASYRREAYGLSFGLEEGEIDDDHPFRHKCVMFAWPRPWNFWRRSIDGEYMATECMMDEHVLRDGLLPWGISRRIPGRTDPAPFYTFANIAGNGQLAISTVSCGPYPVLGEDFYEQGPACGRIDFTWENTYISGISNETLQPMPIKERDAVLATTLEDIQSKIFMCGSLAVAVTGLAFQALALEEEIIVHRKARRGSRKARTRLKGVKNIRPIELDESGLFTWSKRAVYRRATDKGIKLHPSDMPQRVPGGPKTLHVVNPFMGIRWVRKPLPGEKILRTREGKKSTLFAVKRYVKRHTRGQDIHLDEGRMFVRPTR